MMRIIAAPLRFGIVVALSVFCLPVVTSAATITMYLTDLDVTYLGSQNNGSGAIYDATALAGADGSFVVSPTPNADELQAASFKLDSTALGTIVDSPGSSSDNMWGDLRVNGGVGPASLATLTRNAINFNRGNDGGTFGFDWFVKSGNTLGNFLRLGLTSVNVTLTDGTIPPPGNSEFTISGTASVLSQNMPFGLAFDPTQPVTFSYSAPKPGITGADPLTTTGVLSSGAMTITGVQVPEPASIAMLCISVWIMGSRNLRRR